MENQTDQWTWTWTLIGFRRMSWIPIYLRLMERLSLVVHLSGIFCNIPVLVIFFKDGLASSNANIKLFCFFALARVDVYISAFYTMFRSAELVFLKDRYNTVLLDIEQYGKASAVAMNSVSYWITALITLERLLCILFPLKVS